MKTLAISNVAWVATVRSFVDGDVFRESNIDLSMGDVADRLGYLKAQVDASGKLAADQTWTGSNTFSSGASETNIFTGDNPVQFAGISVASTAGFADEVTFASLLQHNGGDAEFLGSSVDIGTVLKLSDVATLADANVTIANTIVRVPQTTANRTYTLPAGSAGRLVILVRPRSADAHTVTLQDPSAATIGICPVSAQAFIVAQYNGVAWKALMWSNNVTSISTTV